MEYLDLLLSSSKSSLTSLEVIELLSMVSVDPEIPFGTLVPRAIRGLYSELQKHIFCNYMDKETWLRQCYSIQNGSFQGLRDMERVPMSKFVAMCTIHKQAMDQMQNDNPPVIDPGTMGPVL